MGVTSTQDVTGRQTPLVTAPAGELGEHWLHAMGPHLPRLTIAARSSWKNTGMLAGVSDCRRSRKWGCRGRWVLGFKPRLGSHRREDYEVLGRREKILQLWQGEERGPCGFRVLLVAMWRLCQEEKDRKDSC